MLPDILEHNLKVVFCGTAVGERSAELGHYYARPGNQFWPTLASIGLTPKRLSPDEDRSLLRYECGLTDLVKGKAGTDAGLQRGDYDLNAFQAKIERYQPQILCFVGKKAAQVYFGLPSTANIEYDLQQASLGDTRLFVVPSTSGSARRYWNLEPWRALHQLTQEAV